MEAAEEVCGAELDEVADLFDQSLLRAHDDGRYAGRLGMLETIRAYARDRLDASGELERVRDAHAAWCMALGRAAAPQLLSGAHEALLPRYDAEQDDLRACLDWLIDSGRGDDALRLAGDLEVFWEIRGQLGEGRARLEQAIAAAVEPGDEDCARALWGLGRLAAMQGDRARARAVLGQALELHRALQDPRGTTLCLADLALAHTLEPGRRDQAVRLGEEALAAARASADPWTIAVALTSLAISLFDDERDRARALLEESLQLRRGLGEKRVLAIALAVSADLAVSEGRDADAAPMLEEVLSLAIDLDFEIIIVEARHDLARLAFADGDLERAESMLADALERSDRMGDPVRRAGCRFGLARIALARGDVAKAARLGEAAERVTSEAEIALSPFDRWEGR